VYQGQPHRVDEYFAGQGYHMEPSINPADFAIDTIQNGDSDKLCHTWVDMVRKGEHLQWQSNEEEPVQLKPRSAFKPRVAPNFFMQFYFFLWRSLLLQVKLWRSFIVDLFLVLLGGTFLGSIYMAVTLTKSQAMNNLAALVLGLTTSISSLRVFGNNRAVYWREAAAGVNRFSFFLAENVAHLPALLLAPVVFLTTFYSLSAPRTPVYIFYLVFAGTTFSTAAMGYMVSIGIDPRNAQIAAVTICMICGSEWGTVVLQRISEGRSCILTPSLPPPLPSAGGLESDAADAEIDGRGRGALLRVVFPLRAGGAVPV
jgi:hypothetical protein